MRKILFAVVASGSLLGCGDSQPTEVELLETRVRHVETEATELGNRIELLEKSNKFADDVIAKETLEKKEEAERAAKLESLRNGQRLIEQNAKMMCDATGEC